MRSLQLHRHSSLDLVTSFHILDFIYLDGFGAGWQKVEISIGESSVTSSSLSTLQNVFNALSLIGLYTSGWIRHWLAKSRIVYWGDRPLWPLSVGCIHTFFPLIGLYTLMDSALAGKKQDLFHWGDRLLCRLLLLNVLNNTFHLMECIHLDGFGIRQGFLESLLIQVTSRWRFHLEFLQLYTLNKPKSTQYILNVFSYMPSIGLTGTSIYIGFLQLYTLDIP